MASLTEFPLVESLRKRTFQQGFQQGLRLGFQQGFQQGLRLGLRQVIQEALAIRFAEDEVQAVADRLAAIEQVDQLQALLRTAIRVEQLADFTRLLDEITAE